MSIKEKQVGFFLKTQAYNKILKDNRATGKDSNRMKKIIRNL